MPNQPPDRPLGAFLQALKKEKIDCILIGMMAAVEQGAPLSTIDYDFWVNLPERQYLRVHALVRDLKGIIVAPTLFELLDGTQVNIVFRTDGLRSFKAELKNCHRGSLAGQPVWVLNLPRIIASKRASGRPKDLAVLPILSRTLRLSKSLGQPRRPR
jgi:hypothetical protein